MNPEILQRRKDIITLLARGFSMTELAEALKIPADTVYNDLREIRNSTCAAARVPFCSAKRTL